MAKVNEIVVWNRASISRLVGNGNIIAMRFGTEEQVWNGKQCFFFSGKFPPQTITKFCLFFGCLSHFLSSQKQFPPLNHISRKNPDGK